MRIGIVGAGQLGTQLYSQLKNKDTDVYVYSKRNGFNACKIDVANEIAECNDVIINCAAMTDVNLCETDLQQAMQANAVLPIVLCTECKEHNKRFIHISTDYVYGDKVDPTAAIVENDETAPVNFYGATKVIADNFIEENTKNSLILRASWLFGNCTHINFIGKICAKLELLGTGDLPVVADQYGIPTSTSLIGDVISCWLNGEIEDGLYNIRNESNGPVSRYDIAKYIASKAFPEKEAQIVPCTSANMMMTTDKVIAKRQHSSFLSIEKLKKELNRSPSISKKPKKRYVIPTWQEAVDDYLKEYTKFSGK